MKKILYLLLGIVLLSSCGKEENITPSDPSGNTNTEPKKVRISFGAGMKEAKVACYGQSAEGDNFTLFSGWDRSDAIGVVTSGSSEISKFTCEYDEYAIPASQQLPGVGQLYRRMVFTGLHGESTTYNCIYPYSSSYDDGVVSGFNVPQHQTAYKGSYQRDAVVLYGQSNNGNDVIMQNACALFAVKFVYTNINPLDNADVHPIVQCSFGLVSNTYTYGNSQFSFKNNTLSAVNTKAGQQLEEVESRIFSPAEGVFYSGYYFLSVIPGQYKSVTLNVKEKSGRTTVYGVGNATTPFNIQPGKMYRIVVNGVYTAGDPNSVYQITIGGSTGGDIKTT